MIIDSHCHAWRYWPYQPPVPDPESRGNIEQLLFEMEQAGVDEGLLICARIDHNPDNNDYVAEKVKEYPEQVIQFPDVDCSWTDTYHTPGAAQRLADAADKYGVKGFTHYLKHEDDGAWLLSDEGNAFFEVAVERNLIASIACIGSHHRTLRAVAERFPSLVILCHHMSHANVRGDRTMAEMQANLAEVVESAKLPNIYSKVSGFHYGGAPRFWDYPYSESHWVLRVLYESYGPHRLCWGSDYPVVRRFMTYRQSLEVVRSHCPFISAADMDWILGKTLHTLLNER